MRIFTILLSLALSMFSVSYAHAGSCDHSWQTASDGSACGGRASDSRPGGR